MHVLNFKRCSAEYPTDGTEIYVLIRNELYKGVINKLKHHEDDELYIWLLDNNNVLIEDFFWLEVDALKNHLM